MAAKNPTTASVHGMANVSQPKTQLWSTAVVTGITVYIIIDIVLTMLRPDYSWLHNAESDFGRGPYFWLMDANFILRCFFSLALAKALWDKFSGSDRLKHVVYWIALWAVASGLLAFFADNPYGYKPLWSGPIHLLLAFIAFSSIVVAMVLMARLLSSLRFNPATKNVLIGLTIAACIAFLLLGHALSRPNSLGGLYERIFLLCVLAWEAVLAVGASKLA